MKRFRLFLLVCTLLCSLGPLYAQEATTRADVAYFAPHKLGKAGYARLCEVLDANHISYQTVEYAATYLIVDPKQRDAAKKVIKELIEKEKLPIRLSDDGGPF